MNAALYECQVWHHRLAPRQNPFRYQIFMLSIDLDAPPRVPFLSHNRWNLFSLNQEDHVNLGHPGGIKENLLAWLREQEIDLPPETRVRLITLPRVLGYAFNPVSFYYLTTPDHQPLLAVAEVTNTFREMKLFVVDSHHDSAWTRLVPKEFYVSPFSDTRDFFDFHLGNPAENWSVKINNLANDEVTLTSSIQGRQRPLTGPRLLWFALKYPLLSLKIIVMIHYQALKLWLKKVPYFRKAENPDSQNDLLRPHSSLKPKP